MFPKPRLLCMERDDLVLQERNTAAEKWLQTARSKQVYSAVRDLVLEHKHGQPKRVYPVVKGGYNIVYRVEYMDGTSVVMRVPIKGLVPFPDEKVRYEVATIRYVAANTTIPVPRVYGHGNAAENPTGLGPFIIMDWIEHDTNMSRALLDTKRPADWRPILDPDIDQDRLEFLYRQMANILLQLSTLTLPRIGSLVEDGEDVAVGGRPLTMNMADIIADTNAPASVLPHTATKTESWYSALADMHMAQLVFQHNDAVDDEDDARDKYVARQLFRNLTAEGWLSPPDDNIASQRFRLVCEDLRPANVLLDKDLRVVGVIDWEFAYAAPEQFSCDPPWWLLLEVPEDWPGGLVSWMKAYEPRLRTFLGVLEVEEKARGLLARGDDEQQLSQRMRASWESGLWMVNYAARKSWVFDLIWWKFLDQSYFGLNETKDYRSRLDLLTEPQRKAMEGFVARKMKEKGDQKLVKWEESSIGRLAEVLV
ncbi:phosphotransferase family protein [Apodospora peruviana]|uniref:Phosphotransferase family protein n=1 Tax=Apodospora peruviana TaxID=516989 RepID=A0AAE0HZD4_9PEZI|nr:phosphotransferase family protein [Apodospora peruviana]